MRRMKVYLDTSVISHLIQPELPEKTQKTLEIWDYFKQGKCDVCISESVLTELLQCREPKQSGLFAFLRQIQYSTLTTDRFVHELADAYLAEKILTNIHRLDLLHLATASVNFCNILLSWNFRHIVQNRTMTGVNATNKMLGYGELMLISPFSFTWED